MTSQTEAEPGIRLDEPLPAQFAVGRGQYQVLSGVIDRRGRPPSELLINQSEQRVCRVELFPGTEKDTLEFFISILWLPKDIGQCHELILTVPGGEQKIATLELGSIELIKEHPHEISPGNIIGDQPLIAICMASYNPDARRLARQLESILCQSYGNWLLIISDDASDEIDWHEVTALCNLDPRRIRLYRHEQKLGFYHNFERALSYVPDNAALIALADQDDEWYPEKLRNLVETLNSEADSVLAYSDMRIVSESGDVISGTYWQNRKNEYRNFATVFLANTVTGAASLFKREMLDVVLPFPVRIGGAFHDHWIACSAMCCGRLAYFDEPQYDYIQYPDSVIGHCDSGPGSVTERVGKLFNQRAQQEGTSSAKWQEVYRRDCLRLQFIADTLKIRLPEKANDSTLNLMNGGAWSALKLLKTYLLGRLMGRTTNGAELGLIMGLLRGRK